MIRLGFWDDDKSESMKVRLAKGTVKGIFTVLDEISKPRSSSGSKQILSKQKDSKKPNKYSFWSEDF